MNTRLFGQRTLCFRLLGALQCADPGKQSNNQTAHCDRVRSKSFLQDDSSPFHDNGGCRTLTARQLACGPKHHRRPQDQLSARRYLNMLHVSEECA